jgi:hypothetical protein
MEAIILPHEMMGHDEDPFTVAEKLFNLMKKALDKAVNISKYLGTLEGSSIRTLKVTRGCYPPYVNLTYNDPAFIKLCGRWLEKAGFNRGDTVQVITIKGMLLIVPVRSPQQ